MWDNGRMTEEEKKKAELLKQQDEAYLFENKYLATIPLDDIEKIQ
jgi:hypothetical protein